MPEPRKAMTASNYLEDYPDWVYLLREFQNAYSIGTAGGSKKIRRHLKEVRERLAKCMTSNPPLVFDPPQRQPVCAHLGRAIDNGERERMGSMVRAFQKISDRLVWQFGYDSMPKDLHNRYAFVEVLGSHGLVRSSTLQLGFVLFAPGTTYPAHAHEGIAESYICLSGTTSENDMGVFVPGSLIFNMPNHEHTITTSDREPVLLSYAWIGSEEDLAHQVMKFSPSPRKATW
jgi:dimethylpropiothetin dethiomethylase